MGRFHLNHQTTPKTILLNKKIGIKHSPSCQYLYHDDILIHVLYICADRKIVEIYPTMKTNIRPICDFIHNSLKESHVLWSGMDITSTCINSHVDNHFAHPYITNTSPQGIRMNPYKLALYRKKSTPGTPKPTDQTLYQIKHLVNNISRSNCVLHARFIPTTLAALKKLNETTFAHKEISGKLYVKNIHVNSNDNTIHELALLENSFNGSNSGNNVDKTSAVYGRFNFHTHPPSAYKKFSVKNGWPSATDYTTIMKMNREVLFHTVVTLEGLYLIVTNHKYNDTIPHDKLVSFIKTNYKINQNANMTPQEYVSMISKKKYDTQPLFKVIFLPWVDAHKPIKMYYPKIDKTCLSTQKQFDNYNSLHMT